MEKPKECENFIDCVRKKLCKSKLVCTCSSSGYCSQPFNFNI